MKKYIRPEADMVSFEVEDVILSSMLGGIFDISDMRFINIARNQNVDAEWMDSWE